VNKLIKNIKQKFNFKKNIIDIKLPTAILEDDQIPTTPNTTIVPNNSRLSTLSEIKPNKNNLITIDSKKSTLHQQPYYTIDEKITKQAHSEAQKLPPPPPNREMLTRIYNACNRKLKKPKLKVKPINQDNFEIENNQMNEPVKTSKINKSSINNSKYKLILEYRNSDEKNHLTKPFVHTETKLRRAKFNENLKIESISSFSSVNYSLLNRQQIENETRPSYRLKTNNLQLNPTVKVDDPIKENIKNYRTRLDDINQKLNNLNNVNVNNNNNQFYVTEFIDEISKKNTSEPDAATEFNQFKMKKDKNKNYTSSEFNLASTKSISVIDLSDLTNEHDQKRIPFFSAFRPMRLNEYIKNTKNKPTKTLASLVIDKQLNQQKSVGSVAKRSIEAANNKFSNPVLSDSFMKASSGSTIQDHPTEIYRKDFSITNDSSVNSTRFLETIVSKKRVSFHEQVRK